MYCHYCGARLEEATKFCPNCGKHLEGGRGNTGYASYAGNTGYAGSASYHDRPVDNTNFTEKAARTVNNFADQLNEATGGSGHVELRFRDFFVNVFKRHTEDEQNEIFACGSSKTIPAPENIAQEWPKPWYYSRLFLILAISTMLLYFAYTSLGMSLVLPGLMFVGAMLGPIPILMFLFEINLPRNISIITVIEMFFLGGCLSIITTSLLYQFYSYNLQGIVAAMTVGVIEETGRAAAIAYYISRYKDKRYIFNGLLIGGAVGAGFDFFETAGYILSGSIELYSDWFSYGVQFNTNNLMGILIARGLTDLGGHVAWGAVTGAAIIIALDHREFSWSQLGSPIFLKFLLITILLHGIWDMPQMFLPVLVRYAALSCAIWIVIAVIMNRGLKEINSLSKNGGGTL